VPLIDEHVRAVGSEVREYARLHALLARVEARDGSKRLLSSLFLLAFGVTTGGLVLVAAGVALFLWLAGPIAPAGAAAIVAGIYLLIAAGAWWAGWRFMRGAGAILLPRTRAMLWEAITCRDKPTNSSTPSAPADGV
jgi:uncharacterized membrane protein YqjE